MPLTFFVMLEHIFVHEALAAQFTVKTLFLNLCLINWTTVRVLERPLALLWNVFTI